jgi:hypothetical protein
MLIQKYRSTFFKHTSKNVDKKMLATLMKNINEKKCWQHLMLTKKFRQHSRKMLSKIYCNTPGKMLMKNIGNTPGKFDETFRATLPKNGDQKMLASLLKNVDKKKCWQHLILMKKM